MKLQILNNALDYFKKILLNDILENHELIAEQIINQGRYRLIKTREKGNLRCVYHFMKYTRMEYLKHKSESVNKEDLDNFISLRNQGQKTGMFYVVYEDGKVLSTSPDNFVEFGRIEADDDEHKKKYILDWGATDERKKRLWNTIREGDEL